MPNQADALFINHDAVDTDETRRHVRSRAAQHSHRVGPRKPKASKRSRATSSKHRDQSPNRQRPDASASGSHQADDQSADDPNQESSSAASSRRPSTVTSEHSRPSPTSSVSGSQPRAVASASTDVTRQPSAIVARSAHYPVEPLPWYPRLLDYMWPWMQRSWQHLDTTSAERAEALRWVQHLTLSDPCYFYMNMLSVADSLSHQGLLDPRYKLWLGGKVVATLNRALQGSRTACSPGTILTVGRIAVREIVVGDRHVGTTIHRPAQVRLMAMAGGLASLGLPVLVLKHILWADRLVTAITGVSMTELDPMAIPADLARMYQRPLQQDLQMLRAYNLTGSGRGAST